MTIAVLDANGAVAQILSATELTALLTAAATPATQAVSNATLPLPTGAATQATLASLLAKVISAPSTEAKQDAMALLQAPYTTVTVLTVGGGTAATGRAFRIVATAAGNVTVTLSGGGSLVIPVNIGLTELPYAVTAVTASTATATYGNLS